METPYNFNNKNPVAPTIDVDRNFNPFSNKSNGNSPVSYKKETANWESLYVGLQSEKNKPYDEASNIQFESEVITPDIFEKQSTSVFETYQLHNKYIVNTIKSGMLLIDQNKAHQRILYEQFLHDLTLKEATSQQLLFPLQLEFSSSEIIIIKELQEQLEQTGFVFSKVDKTEVSLTGIPVSATESNIATIFEGLINDVQNDIPNSHFSQTDMLAKSLAKSLAIKNGQVLSQQEQEHLLNSLFACKEPNTTPFGAVTFVTLSVDEIDKKFN
jgi:DNA mismatch repair protein MutL